MMNCPRTIRYSLAFWSLASVLSALSGCQSSPSEADVAALERETAGLVTQVSEAEGELWQATATLHAVEAENRLLIGRGQVAAPVLPGGDDATTVQAHLTAQLAGALEQRNGAIGDAALIDQIASLEKEATEAAGKASAALAGRPNALRQVEAAHRALLNDAAAPGRSPTWRAARSVLSRDFLLLWIICLAAFLAVWAICRHEFRRDIRSRRRALVNAVRLQPSRAGFALNWLKIERLALAVVLALVVIVASIPAVRPGSSQLRREHLNRLTARKNQLTTRLADLQNSLKAKTEELATAGKANERLFGDYLAAFTGAAVGTPPADSSLDEYQVAAREQLRAHARALGVAESAGEAVRNSNTAAEDDAALERWVNGERLHERNQGYLRGGLFLTFLGANLGLVLQWHRRRRRRRGALANDCPRCAGEGTLKDNAGGPPAPGVSVRCQNAACGYEVAPEHRFVERVCIPTAGLTETGKTVWLTMFHREVEAFRASTALVTFQRAESPDVESARFEAVLQELQSGIKPAQTRFAKDSIPAPLLFHFSDGEGAFKTSGILNLFDFAGATLSKFLNDTPLQKRALEMDSFVYFIDASMGAKNPELMHEQREQLENFCKLLRETRHAPYGQGIDATVAVCISKLDVNLDENSRFIEELLAAPHTTQPPAENPARRPDPTLAEIRRRHALFAANQERFFPGWDIARQLESLVGGRYMFFPLSSRGFSHSASEEPPEPKEADFKDWNFNPFGVTEPVIWLLHMNGFKVL